MKREIRIEAGPLNLKKTSETNLLLKLVGCVRCYRNEHHLCTYHNVRITARKIFRISNKYSTRQKYVLCKHGKHTLSADQTVTVVTTFDYVKRIVFFV